MRLRVDIIIRMSGIEQGQSTSGATYLYPRVTQCGNVNGGGVEPPQLRGGVTVNDTVKRHGLASWQLLAGGRGTCRRQNCSGEK